MLLLRVMEWEMTCQEEMEKDAEAPNISSLVICTLYHLRRNVLACADQASIADELAGHESSSQAEIGKQEPASIQMPIILHHLVACFLQGSSLVDVEWIMVIGLMTMVDEHILQFHIPMHDPVPVAML
jgi:hypothetical protein